MKKRLWLGGLTLALLLAGCGEDTQTNDNEQQEAVATEEVVREETTEEHAHTHDKDDVYKGYFDDAQVADRPLSDWAGDWQSVYPFLQDGTLDEVFEHKAEHDASQTADDIKAYYTIGYETDVSRIVIDGHMITFYQNGQAHTGEFVYDGYEILTYEKGNRGVRFIFKHIGDDAVVPTYIQFSDHIIAPQTSDHYHIYMGNDRAQLLEEMDNWPTYYPANLTGHDIAHEMIAH
ncbi:ZinT family metal-binding protein [Caryophanon tenue]|uniref:Metal-binding protein n=1 Tax=Caryophanon tenue TaxID=33978 RepID=A0A1C0YIW1_9BACL|nr:metal-binding protein ZinT [Caryophanon tenue]OCS87084.1 metal-binding protein [Caryophanon tenue]